MVAALAIVLLFQLVGEVVSRARNPKMRPRAGYILWITAGPARDHGARR